MIDSFGRHITYLRVSVTDRCDLRCTYCMTPDQTFVPRDDILTLEELGRCCRVFSSAGVRKIRVTGGEPLTRRNVIHLFRELGPMVGCELDELTLTTNGTQLARHARELVACGVRRVNVSLDTLDRARFQALTGRDALPDVLEGIAAARQAGLTVKVNAVTQGDSDEDDLHHLLEWCGYQNMDLTVIEAMPMGRTVSSVPTAPAERLAGRWTLIPTTYATGGPARYFMVAETGTRLGVISPLSSHFCDSCNRIRLTCEGRLRLCLGRGDSVDLRGPLRSGTDDDTLRQHIVAAIAGKPAAHSFLSPGMVSTAMSKIGG